MSRELKIHYRATGRSSNACGCDCYQGPPHFGPQGIKSYEYKHTSDPAKVTCLRCKKILGITSETIGFVTFKPNPKPKKRVIAVEVEGTILVQADTDLAAEQFVSNCLNDMLRIRNHKPNMLMGVAICDVEDLEDVIENYGYCEHDVPLDSYLDSYLNFRQLFPPEETVTYKDKEYNVVEDETGQLVLEEK